MWEMIQTTGVGVLAGVGWGLLNFFKNKKHLQQGFDAERLVSSLFTFAIVGAVFGLFGMTNDLGLFESSITIIGTSQILKAIYKTLFLKIKETKTKKK